MMIFGRAIQTPPPNGWECPFCGWRDYGMTPGVHSCIGLQTGYGGFREMPPTEIVLWNILRDWIEKGGTR